VTCLHSHLSHVKMNILAFLTAISLAFTVDIAMADNGPVLTCSNFSPAGGRDKEPDYEIRLAKEAGSLNKYKVSIVGKDGEEFEKFIIQVG